MVQRSATASISATIGAAAATVVVAGGILAWPLLSPCLNDPQGVGACLREALAEREILAPLPDRPPQPAGWLDVRANEIEPLPPEPVALADPMVSLGGSGLPPPEIMEQVALAPSPSLPPASAPMLPESVATVLGPLGKVDASGRMDAAAPASVAVTGEITGALTAGEVLRATEAPSLAALGSLAKGELDAGAGPLAGTAAPSVALSPLPPAMRAGSASGMATQMPVEVTPLPPSVTAPVAFEGPPAPVAIVLPLPATPAPSPVEIVEPEPEAPVPTFDPSFPNVLVLPAPATGQASSIRTLTLD